MIRLATRLALLFLLGTTVGRAAPARAADHLTVLLDWFVDANHAALFAAQYSGAYARHRLDVTLLPPADPNQPPRLVAAGQADIAVSYETELHLLAARGLPLMRVGSLVDRPLNTLLALGEGPIRTLSDLKGRRVGVSIGGADEALLSAMLESAGLRLADVTVIPLNVDLETALLSHKIDAFIGGMRNYEEIDLRQRGLHPIAFNPEDHGVPPFDELVLLTRTPMAHDDRIRRFLVALKEGTAALHANPAAILARMTADHPELDSPLNRAAWTATLPLLSADPAALDIARYARFSTFLFRHGLLSRDVPVDRYATVP